MAQDLTKLTKLGKGLGLAAQPFDLNNNVIDTGSLKSSVPFDIPEMPEDTTTDFDGIINDVVITPTPEIPITPSVTPESTEQSKDGFTDLKDFLQDTPEPVDPNIAFQEESKRAGIEEKQRLADEASSAVTQETANLAAINAQLLGISNRGKQAQLQLEQEAGGKNITTAFLGRQQQEITRQVAISALPVQSLALASQAKIQALQGNEAAAQTILTRATEKLNTAFLLRSQHEDRLFAFNNDIRDRIYKIADAETQRIIDADKEEKTREYNEKKDMIDLAQRYSVIALQNGDSEIASALTNPDITKNEIMDFIGQIEIAQEPVSGVGSGIIGTGPGGQVTVDDLSPLARAVYNGTASLKDLTPTDRASVIPELDAIGWNKKMNSEASDAIDVIINGMSTVTELWNKIPGIYKGTLGGRFGKITVAKEYVKELAAFDTASKTIGMQVTRLWEKGRISDADREFYLSLMPNVNQNEEAMKASAKQLVDILNLKKGDIQEPASVSDDGLSDEEAWEVYNQINK